MTSPGAAGQLTSRQIWWIVGGLMVGMFLQGLDVLLIVTALPTIVGDLGGLDKASWALTSYLITATASVPVWGKLGDLWGRKRLFQFAIVLFTVTSFLCAGAQTMNQLILARTLRGIGGGGLVVLPPAIIAEIVPARSRARYQGALGANVAVATLLGPLIGGFLVDHASWRWAFLVGVPPAAVALIASRRLNLASRRASIAGVDFVGAIFVVAISVVFLLVVTTGGRSHAWVSVTSVALLAAAAALLVALILWERRVPDPMVPLRMFPIRGFSMLMGCAFLSGVAMQGPWSVMPLFLQLVTGASATMAGLLLLPLIVSITLSSFAAGHFISRTGRVKVVLVVGTTLATTGFALYTRLDSGSSRQLAGAMMVVTGLGIGCIIQPLIVAAAGDGGRARGRRRHIHRQLLPPVGPGIGYRDRTVGARRSARSAPRGQPPTSGLGVAVRRCAVGQPDRGSRPRSRHAGVGDRCVRPCVARLVRVHGAVRIASIVTAACCPACDCRTCRPPPRSRATRVRRRGEWWLPPVDAQPMRRPT